LTADHHFSFEGHTDGGAGETDQGVWLYEKDVLVLKPEKRTDAHHWTGTAVRFVPVRWGSAVTLVEEAAAPGFFGVKNQDPEAMDSIHSLDYRKLKESVFESIPRSGNMQYPPRFADFVANGPVLATVKARKPKGTVRLESKALKRIKVGMLFTTSDWSDIDVEITNVDAHGAEGIVYYFFNSNRMIKPGDRLTTGGRYITPHDRDDSRLPSPPKRK
jgi:hypothetical protein